MLTCFKLIELCDLTITRLPDATINDYGGQQGALHIYINLSIMGTVICLALI